MNKEEILNSLVTQALKDVEIKFIERFEFLTEKTVTDFIVLKIFNGSINLKIYVEDYVDESLETTIYTHLRNFNKKNLEKIWFKII